MFVLNTEYICTLYTVQYIIIIELYLKTPIFRDKVIHWCIIASYSVLMMTLHGL